MKQPTITTEEVNFKIPEDILVQVILHDFELLNDIIRDFPILKD